MTIITIINQKGGIGKSTTSHSIAAGLSLNGFKVLLVDLDSQMNLSQSTRVDVNNNNNTHSILVKGTNVKDAIQHVKDNLDIIIGSPNLAHCDMEMMEVGKEYRLKEKLSELNGMYDYIVIDTPPALGVITINALTCANFVLVPCQADVFSVDAIMKLNDTINMVRTCTNKDLQIIGVLLTRYNKRSVLTRQIKDVISDMAKNMGSKLYDTEIREAIAIKESQATKQDIFEYAPKSKVANDYMKIVKEIMKER